MATLFEFDFQGELHRLSMKCDRFYVLPDHTFLKMVNWPAWCAGCQEFVEAERIPSVEELEQEISELEYFARHPGHIPPDRLVRVGRIPELQTRLNWRLSRIAAPKCLVCGSEAVTLIWPGPDVDIPGKGKCVGRFRRWADMGKPPKYYYTPEGVPLDGRQ